MQVFEFLLFHNQQVKVKSKVEADPCNLHMMEYKLPKVSPTFLAVKLYLLIYKIGCQGRHQTYHLGALASDFWALSNSLYTFRYTTA